MISPERWNDKFTSKKLYLARPARPEVTAIKEKLLKGTIKLDDALDQLMLLGYSEKEAKIFIDEHSENSSAP